MAHLHQHLLPHGQVYGKIVPSRVRVQSSWAWDVSGKVWGGEVAVRGL